MDYKTINYKKNKIDFLIIYIQPEKRKYAEQ